MCVTCDVFQKLLLFVCVCVIRLRSARIQALMYTARPEESFAGEGSTSVVVVILPLTGAVNKRRAQRLNIYISQTRLYLSRFYQPLVNPVYKPETLSLLCEEVARAHF